MAIWQKELKPVDRALDEVRQQLAALERQQRAAETGRPATAGESLSQFVKRMLTPPPKAVTSPYRPVPDVDVNPMNALEADTIPFSQQREPDLFSHTSNMTTADDKLGKFLAAGSLRPPKPTLKRVQRETRNRFFMWMGLSLVALWLIIVVVR